MHAYIWPPQLVINSPPNSNCTPSGWMGPGGRWGLWGCAWVHIYILQSVSIAGWFRFTIIASHCWTCFASAPTSHIHLSWIATTISANNSAFCVDVSNLCDTSRNNSGDGQCLTSWTIEEMNTSNYSHCHKMSHDAIIILPHTQTLQILKPNLW